MVPEYQYSRGLATGPTASSRVILRRHFEAIHPNFGYLQMNGRTHIHAGSAIHCLRTCL
jgi:hypothetical protein